MFPQETGIPAYLRTASIRAILHCPRPTTSLPSLPWCISTPLLSSRFPPERIQSHQQILPNAPLHAQHYSQSWGSTTWFLSSQSWHFWPLHLPFPLVTLPLTNHDIKLGTDPRTPAQLVHLGGPSSTQMHHDPIELFLPPSPCTLHPNSCQ